MGMYICKECLDTLTLVDRTKMWAFSNLSYTNCEICNANSKYYGHITYAEINPDDYNYKQIERIKRINTILYRDHRDKTNLSDQ